MQRMRQVWRRKLVKIAVIGLIIIVPAIIWLNHWSSAPAKTTIQIAQPAPAAAVKVTYKPLTTAYFKTEVPSAWTIKPATTVNNRLQILSISAPGSNGQLGLTSAIVPSEGLNGVGDYNLRKTDTTNYAVVADPALPAGATLFMTRTGTPSYSAFLVHNGRYAAITVSDFETLPASHTFLLHVLGAWQWTTP